MIRPPTSLASSSRSNRFAVPNLEVSAGAYSVCGTNRSNNEDYQYVSPDRSVFMVADGMGGHQAGEFASRFVVDTLTHELNRTFDDDAPDEDVESHVKAAFEHANYLLLDAAADNPRLEGAGTTAIVALTFGERLFVSGVGDSRAYLLRAGQLKQLTLDDSLTAYLERAGVISSQEAAHHPMRNRLCAYMGMKNFEPDSDFCVIRMQPDDVVLLCSDGLTDVCNDDVIHAILESHQNPQLAARQLVQTAVEYKAKDDITCVVFRVDTAEEEHSHTHSEGGNPVVRFLEGLKQRFGGRPTPAV